MKFKLFIAYFILLHFVHTAFAQTVVSSVKPQKTLAEELSEAKHQPISQSTPQLSAITSYLETIANDDFNAYQKISLGTSVLTLSGTETEEMRKAMFKAIRDSIPRKVLITAPYAMPSGNFLFHALGCKDGYIREAIIGVGMVEKHWRLSSGIWFPDSKKTTCAE